MQVRPGLSHVCVGHRFLSRVTQDLSPVTRHPSLSG